jgi:hypothetical protein
LSVSEKADFEKEFYTEVYDHILRTIERENAK